MAPDDAMVVDADSETSGAASSSAASAAAAAAAAVGAADRAQISRGLTNCYFSGRNSQQLVKHQIDSYNDFASRKLEQIVDGFNPIDISNTYLPEAGCHKHVLSLQLQNPTLTKPLINEKDGSTKVMLPNDARLRNMTYAAPLAVDVVLTAKTWSAEAGAYQTDVKRIANVGLGRVPVMVRSRYCMLSHPSNVSACSGVDECRYDYGGYFVINGAEKVIISQVISLISLGWGAAPPQRNWGASGGGGVRVLWGLRRMGIAWGLHGDAWEPHGGMHE